ncbi:hypothetical protein [Amycolatopsis circi]|nr:hypothetical protein [Amycolatopsis circi]
MAALGAVEVGGTTQSDGSVLEAAAITGLAALERRHGGNASTTREAK